MPGGPFGCLHRSNALRLGSRYLTKPMSHYTLSTGHDRKSVHTPPAMLHSLSNISTPQTLPGSPFTWLRLSRALPLSRRSSNHAGLTVALAASQQRSDAWLPFLDSAYLSLYNFNWLRTNLCPRSTCRAPTCPIHPLLKPCRVDDSPARNGCKYGRPATA